ncbi:unnamed protein product, partial [Leptidea sinapis]
IRMWLSVETLSA